MEDPRAGVVAAAPFYLGCLQMSVSGSIYLFSTLLRGLTEVRCRVYFHFVDRSGSNFADERCKNRGPVRREEDDYKLDQLEPSPCLGDWTLVFCNDQGWHDVQRESARDARSARSFFLPFTLIVGEAPRPLRVPRWARG